MKYEMMLVVSGKSNPEAFVSGVEKSLKDANVASLKVERLGKKTLAYSIKKHTEGEYYVFNFEAGGEVIGSLNQQLRLEQEALLRYLIIKPQTKSKDTGTGVKAEVLPKVIVKTVTGQGKTASVTKEKIEVKKEVKVKPKPQKRKVAKVKKGKTSNK